MVGMLAAGEGTHPGDDRVMHPNPMMQPNPEIDLTERERPDGLTATFDVLPMSVAVLDADGWVVLTNRAWRAAEPEGIDRLAGLSLGDHLDAVSDPTRQEPTPTEQYLVEGTCRVLDGRSERFELHYRLAYGDHDRWFVFNASALPEGGLVLSRLETTEHDQANEALADLAFHDPLTRLPNRSLVADRIGMTLGRTNRSGAWTAVMFADLDGFKKVNDTLGHLTGDQVLVEVAQRLLTVVRAEDTCGRWGGDEFVLVMELPDADAVPAIAARVKAALAPPVLADGTLLQLDASLGVALAGRLYPVDELLRLADDAMYTAKRDGTGLHVVTAAA